VAYGQAVMSQTKKAPAKKQARKRAMKKATKRAKRVTKMAKRARKKARKAWTKNFGAVDERLDEMSARLAAIEERLSKGSL
jgi:hypothetical protein